MKTLFNIPLLMLVLTIGCSKPDKLDPSIEKEQIKEHFKNWVKGAERGDVNDYFNFITDDFIYMGPGRKPISDRDSLRSFLDKFFSSYTFSLPNWVTHEIEIRDDLAIHRYSGIAYIKGKTDSTIIELDRKYLDVLKKNEKGEWKAYLHSFSNNK